MRYGVPAPPSPAGRAGAVVLAGSWSTPHVRALGACFTIVDSTDTAQPDRSVDWLLAAAEPGMPASVRNLAQSLRASSSPGLKMAVVDRGFRWPAGADCDVYIAGDVDPGELVTTLWLAGRGFSVSRFTASAPHWRERGTQRSGVPQHERKAALREPSSALTDRETQLLQALCAGLGNDRIARELHITRSTVEFHLTRIFKKLEVSSRAEAIVRVLQHGIPV